MSIHPFHPLKKIDIFSKSYNFMIDNENEFKTRPGGILTILLGFISAFCIWYFGKDIYEKKNPLFLVKNTLYGDIPIEPLNNDEFFYGIRLEDNNGHDLLDPRKYDYQLHYIISKFFKENNSYIYVQDLVQDLNICNLTHWNHSETFEKENINMYMCANLDGIKVGGEWLTTIHVPRFTVSRCSNETEKRKKIKCLKDGEFEQDETVYFTEKFYMPLIDPKNHTSPIIKQLKNKWRALNFNNLEVQNNFYTHSHVNTDNAILTKEFTTRHFFEFYETINDNKNIGPNSRLFQSDFYLDRSSKEYERVYLKIPDIAANVGGILSIIFVGMKFIFSFYLEASYYLYLNNQLFKIYDDDKIDNMSSKLELDLKDKPSQIPSNYDKKNLNIINIEDNSKDPIKTFDKDSKSKNPFSEGLEKKKSKLFQTNHKSLLQENKDLKKGDFAFNKNLYNLVEFKKKKHIQVNVNYPDMFAIITFQPCYKLCLSSKKHKYDLLFITNVLLRKKLDIVRLLKVPDQVDLLSKLLLNEQQSKMLNFHSIKTVYHNQYVKPNDKHKDEDEDDIDIIEKLKVYYLRKKIKEEVNISNYLNERQDKNKLTDVDKVLYLYLDEDIKTNLNFKIDMDK